jgi:hypothetical protein
MQWIEQLPVFRPRALRCAGLALLALPFWACDPPRAPQAGQPAAGVELKVAEIMKNPNVLERNRDLASLLLSLGKESAPEVAAGLKDSFSDWGDNELVLFAEWWGPLDPNATYDWAVSEWRARHPRVLYTLMRAVARVDPQAAVELYRKRPTALASFKRDYPMELEGIIVGWFESGKPGLIDYMVSQPNPIQQQNTLGTFARLKVLELGAQGAMDWAEKAAKEDVSGNVSRYVLQRIAASVGEVDGELAAKWAEEQVKLGETKTLIQRVAGRWVRREPQRAMEWLEKFDVDDSDYQMAIDTTFRDWYRLDRIGSKSWLESQGDDRFGWLAPATAVMLRFEAYFAHSDQTQKPDWEGLMQTAQKLPERMGYRWGTVAVIAGFWLNRDPAAAEDWMESASVPEVFRVKARQRSANPRP